MCASLAPQKGQQRASQKGDFQGFGGEVHVKALERLENS